MHKRHISLTILFLLISLVALGGCGGGSDPSGALSAWTGTWRSMSTYMDDPAIVPACEAVAAKTSGYTAGGVLHFLKSMYRCDFATLEIEGSTVTYLQADGNTLVTVVYQSAGTAPISGYDSEWNLFEAVETPQKGYRYLAAVKVHGEDMKHWHFRYGNKDFASLIGETANPGWWPTGVGSETTAALVAEDILEEADAYATMLGDPLSTWEGRWVSLASFLDDAAMTPAYAAIAAEAQKTGKIYDTAGVKVFLKQMYATPFAFVEVDGATVSFLNANGTVLAECRMDYDGQVAMTGFDGYFWEHFVAGGTCPGYGRLFLTAPHSDGEGAMEHWHLRFGDGSAEELANPAFAMWFPTCTRPETTVAEFAEDMLEEAAAYASFLP